MRRHQLLRLLLSPAHSDSVWGVAWTRNETLDQELIVSGSVDNTVRVWAWWASIYSMNKTITSLIITYRDDGKSLLEPKWTFEGHQLGIVSVATDPTGTGKQKPQHCRPQCGNFL